MHLNPTYAATGTALETAFFSGDYTPPGLKMLPERRIMPKENQFPCLSVFQMKAWLLKVVLF